MLTLTFPYDFCSLAFASVVLTGALYTVGRFYRRRYYVANDDECASVGPIIGLVLASGVASLTGVLITVTGTLDPMTVQRSGLMSGYVTEHCELSSSTHLLGVVDGVFAEVDPSPHDFQIRREDIFTTGLAKFSEYHGYFQGLIGLAAIVVGIVIVTTARFLVATDNREIYPLLPRAALALALGGCSFVALIASHHLLFIIINCQLSLLGSGYAYCYANFASVYEDLFRMIVFAGTAAIIGLLVLPEALRLSYEK